MNRIYFDNNKNKNQENLLEKLINIIFSSEFGRGRYIERQKKTHVIILYTFDDMNNHKY